MQYRVLIAVTNVRTYEAVVEADSEEEANEKAFGIMPFDEGVVEVDDETTDIEHYAVTPLVEDPAPASNRDIPELEEFRTDQDMLGLQARGVSSLGGDS
jgi:hypothetical protein